MKPMIVEVVSLSDRGRVRQLNQDALVAFPEQGLVILADGMGGHNAGEVASQLAAETVASSLLMALAVMDDAPAALIAAFNEANQTLLAAAQEAADLEGMASTLVVALFHDRRVSHAHVGDSRLYRFRDGRLLPMTRDHSMLQALLDQGMFDSPEAAVAAGVRTNVLTRGIGADGELEVDEGSSEVLAGDLYLLCSDGLSNMLSERLMEETLRLHGHQLSGAADRLMQLALEAGGEDNVSLLLVRPEIP